MKNTGKRVPESSRVICVVSDHNDAGWEQITSLQRVADTLELRNVALLAESAELRRLCEKALTRSAIVHPGFADEIRAALAKGDA